jgi:hypothetical protein
MTPRNSEAAILKRVIEPEVDDLPEETARYLLSLDFKARDLKRMDVLAAKARAGTLKPSQRAELENFEHVSHLLALMQSKARRSLSKVASASS